MAQTSISHEKVTEPALICDSPLSPILGRRRLAGGTSSQPYIFRAQKQVSPNNKGFDKENLNVTPKNKGDCVTLLSALCEKKNIMHVKKRTNSSQDQIGNMPKKVDTKRRIVAEKENFSSTCQLPVRRSKRTKNETKPVLQLMQDGNKNLPRKDLAVKAAGNLKKNILNKVKIAESKQMELGSKVESTNSQHESKRTNTRARANLNCSVEQDTRVIQRTEDQMGKAKLPRRITSLEERKLKKDLSSRTSERSLSNEEATVLPGRTLRRKVDKNNSSPQNKGKGVKDQKKSCNEKVKNSPATSKKSAKSNRNVTLSPKVTCDDQASRSSKSIDGAATSESKQNKQKLPVWASEGKIRRTPGKRKSIRIMDKDIYEFKFNLSEEVPKKRRVVKRRNQGRRTKPKPRTKHTLLTTDPNWEDPLSSLTSFPEVSSSRRGDIEFIGTTVNSSVREGNENVGSSVNSCCRGDTESIDSEHDIDDDFDIHDNQDNNFEGFEFETASLFVGAQEPSTFIPMISASVLNAPAKISHISGYIGGSSTPRDGNTLAFTSSDELGDRQAPKMVQDDIAKCFGFDDDIETEDSVLLNLSPVRCSGSQSHLEVTGMSDLMEVESQPSRFSWSSLKPGIRSYVSGSCSSSMLVHGRSLSTLSSSSSTVQSRKSTVRKTKPGNRVSLPGKKIGDSHLGSETERRKDKSIKSLAQPVTSKPQECDTEHANASFMFEEEAVMESQSKPDREESESSQNHFSELSPPYLSKTPEKSFSKLSKRSYDRSHLNETRVKYFRECGGNISTETDTEKDEVIKKKPQRKKKALRSKKDPKKKKDTKLSESTDSSISNLTVRETKASKKKKRKEAALETSVKEWASDINSHFSEVDDFELMVI